MRRRIAQMQDKLREVVDYVDMGEHAKAGTIIEMVCRNLEILDMEFDNEIDKIHESQNTVPNCFCR